MRTLAIDPGRKGGAALLEDGALVAWACWRPCAGGYRVWQSPAGAAMHCPTLAHVGLVLSWLQPVRLIVESLHIRRKGISSESILKLAEGLGETVAPILLARPVEYVRCDVDAWAALCGGTGPTQTERAVAAVRRRGFALPQAETIAGDKRVSLEDYKSIGAISEAILMSLACAP